MGLENLIKKVKKGFAVLGLATALSFGLAETIQAQSTDKLFFECNYWEDTHGDNQIYYPEGYRGIKHNFKDNEEIIFVGHDSGWVKGNDVEYVLYGPNNGIVSKKDVTIQYDGEWYHAGESIDEDLMYDMMHSSNGGDGHYNIVWYTNGRYDGQDEFKISPSSN